ncbi:hypothetical protein Tco_0808332 [Tanacetum coccineum]
MDITRTQQIALDDALVAPTNRLTIGKIQQHSIHFKMNNKKHIVNLEYFIEMLQICPKLPDQQFEEPPFKEEILTLIRDLGHSGEIKVITDVNVNKLHQPWRSFVAVINKFLSSKSTGYGTVRLSPAQILWGMYHKKNVDYAYLLLEGFVYQVENKNIKRSNEMYYPRFTKAIVNFFMTKDPSIPRRNRVNWHFARDDLMFTTIKVVSRHEDTQLYGAILPDELINDVIKDSESYKEYYAFASEAKPPKTKASVKKKQARSNKTKTPPTAKDKRLNTSTKTAKPAKQKQPTKTSNAKGLTMLSEVALIEAKQKKLAKKRSLIQTHSSHACGLGANEATGGKPGVPDVPTYEYDDEQISWKSSDKEDDDDDNDDDDDADNQDDDGQDDNDLRVPTPSHYESTNDEESDEVTQGGNVEGEELNEGTEEEEKVNELYKDVNVNLEGRDTEMTDAQQNTIHGTHITEDTYVIMTVAAPEFEDRVNALEGATSRNSRRTKPLCLQVVFFNLTDMLYLMSSGSMQGGRTRKESGSLPWISLASHEIKLMQDACMKIFVNFPWSNLVLLRRRAKKEPESTSAPKEKTSKSSGKSKEGSKSHHTSTSKSAHAEEPIHADKDLEEPARQELDTEFSKDQPVDDTTQPHDWGDTSSRTYATSVTKTKAADYGHVKWIEDLQFYGFAVNRESARDVYSRHRIIAVTKLQIIEWHNYKHLDWITIRRNDDKLYTFKEGDYKRLRLQDIEDMLLLLVQGDKPYY